MNPVVWVQSFIEKAKTLPAEVAVPQRSACSPYSRPKLLPLLLVFCSIFGI